MPQPWCTPVYEKIVVAATMVYSSADGRRKPVSMSAEGKAVSI